MFKTKFLVVFCLTIAIAFCFSITFAKEKNGGEINGSQHRSAVANFVQSLLQVADREEGIGPQVKVIAQQQNDSEATTNQAIEKVQSRSKIKTFLIGTDYKNIGALRSEMVQTRNRLDQLKRLIETVTNEADKTELQNQITALEQEQQKIDDFLKANESKFSLFGWFVKLFNR
jgi:predicted  nucleic acid-binding Zn-ribbon protein